MTSERDIARRAIDEVPGWSGAELTPLIGGLTNTTWLAEKDGRRATLKADASVRGFPFASRTIEARMQRLAAVHGLANDVIYASPTVLMTEYVPGRVWTNDDMHDERHLVQLARLLRRVHGLPRSGRRFDALRAAEQYASRVASSSAVERAAVDEHIDILRSLQEPAEFCCCHNDVVAGNILATPALRLLDWEYAADNDPLFDVAIAVVEHDLGDAQVACLLEAYARDRDRSLRDRLSCEVRRYRSLAWLWQAARP